MKKLEKDLINKIISENKVSKVSVEKWISILENHPHMKAHKLCTIVQDNSTYEITLETLKAKQKILKAMND